MRGERRPPRQISVAPGFSNDQQVAVPGIGANRNLPDEKVDDRISTLTFYNSTERPIAVVLQFACHPTILGPSNLLVSADFPGALRRGVRTRMIDSDPVVMFANAASGDVSTRFTRLAQDFGEVGRVGNLLAEAATATSGVTPVARSDGMRVTRRLVTLPAKAVPTVNAALDQLAKCEAMLREAQGREGGDPADTRRAETRVQGAVADLARARGVGLRAAPFTLLAVRLGNIAILGASAEISTSISVRIQEGSRFDDTIVLGLVGGYNGYIADPHDHVAVTYESLTSPSSPAATDVLVEESIALLGEI